MTTTKTNLGDKRSIQITRIASSLVGAIPYVGPVVQAIVAELIPNTRVERLEKFVLELRDRLDDEQLKLSTATEEGLDTFEEGMWQAARALSDDRRKKIAALVSTALTGEDLAKQLARHFLRVLNQLGDADIAILIEYAEGKRSMLGSLVYNPILDDDAERSKQITILERSRCMLLSSFGLLQAVEEGLDNPMFEITRTGRDFVEFLDFDKTEEQPE
ncbi:hypothetical protein GCM10011332_21300 [Terasakiella brassicae]|uniref:Uncharacterized protein n=1 Tax=Terasakiella brassicae TaxID=1634917 RepID=A0A917C2J8_9PROT|nr:hypothetical protein [Terasakiella brassicae]GGF66949.1 hypothetical protein GCM10011332_21300 [Terasakiella brassicae]